MYLVNTGTPGVSLKNFSRNVITQLLERYGMLISRRPGRSAKDIDRLAAVNFCDRHFLQHIPPTATKKKGQCICHVCSNTVRGAQKQTYVTTWCQESKVGLCIVNYFRNFHTLKKF